MGEGRGGGGGRDDDDDVAVDDWHGTERAGLSIVYIWLLLYSRGLHLP